LFRFSFKVERKQTLYKERSNTMKKAKVTPATVGQEAAPEAKKEHSMKLLNLNNEIYELRILGQDGKIAADLRFEKYVKGWDKDKKKADSSYLRLSVNKPINAEETKEVKRYVIGHSEESNLIWVGDAKLEATERIVEEV